MANDTEQITIRLSEGLKEAYAALMASQPYGSERNALKGMSWVLEAHLKTHAPELFKKYVDPDYAIPEPEKSSA